MPFEHRILQAAEDDSLLNCENVEALDGLDILADQLREDASYLVARYPAEMPGHSGLDRQASGSGLSCSVDADRARVDQHRERCLSRVNELLETRRRSCRVAWLRRLAGGAAVAAVGLICASIASRVQVPQAGIGHLPDRGSGITSIAKEQYGQTLVLEHSNRERLLPGAPLNHPFFTGNSGLTSSVSPMPVVLEMPAVFRSASEPEMEALLDLYDSETAGPVAIGF